MTTNSNKKLIFITAALAATFSFAVLTGCKGPAYPLCKNDSHCKIGSAGETLNGVCVNGHCQECAMNSDCQDGKQCVENSCKEASLPKKDSSMSEGTADGDCSFENKTVHFDFDKYDIGAEDASNLNKVAKCLVTDEQVKLVIDGNTDERGSSEYNLALGQRRANAVAKYLANNGVFKNRLKTVSYGKERPVDTASNEDAWTKNRRSEIKAQ